MKKIILILIILALIVSIFSYEKIIKALFFAHGEESYKLPQEFSFRMPEMDSLFITTRKIKNKTKSASFYVIFSKDSLIALSDSTDYVEFETAEEGITIVFNPNEKNNIYVKNSENLAGINVVNYNLRQVEQNEFYSEFFEPQIKTNPYILKYPYIELNIITMSHLIFVNRYSFIQEKIKQ